MMMTRLSGAVLRRQKLAPALLPLLTVAVMLNAADRGNLSTVAPVLRQELHINHTQLGILLGSFFFVYAPSQLLAGIAAERFTPRWVIGGGFLLWALATLLTGFAHGFAMILALRLVLGFGESSLFPAASKFFATHTAESERGRANGLFLSGLSLGPALGTLLGGIILARSGWREVFFVFGTISLLWLIPWSFVPLPPAPPQTAQPAPNYRDIIARRPALGMALGHFSVNYMGYFTLTWLPSYLVNDRHLSIGAMAYTGGAIYLVEALSAVLCGYWGDRAIGRGFDAGRLRKTMLIAGTGGIAVFMLAAGFAPTRPALLCLALAAAARGMQLPSMYAAAQSFAGPRAAGRWMGFQNCVANFAGILAPVLTGYAIDLTGSYITGFVLVALFALLGVVAWAIVIGPIEPVNWDYI
jgi:MFS family permease